MRTNKKYMMVAKKDSKALMKDRIYAVGVVSKHVRNLYSRPYIIYFVYEDEEPSVALTSCDLKGLTNFFGEEEVFYKAMSEGMEIIS
jgi:hypothetical protein